MRGWITPRSKTHPPEKKKNKDRNGDEKLGQTVGTERYVEGQENVNVARNVQKNSVLASSGVPPGDFFLFSAFQSMWISLKVISAQELQSSFQEDIKYREVGIRDISLASFEANVKRIAGAFKPLVFNIEKETLVTLAHPAFLVYVAQDSIICSFIERADDGVSRATLAIQHQLDLA